MCSRQESGFPSAVLDPQEDFAEQAKRLVISLGEPDKSAAHIYL